MNSSQLVETIYTPGVMVVFMRDGSWKKVSLLEAERICHPYWDEAARVRRAEWRLAQMNSSVRRDDRSKEEGHV